ncbi:MAG: UDP-N-acetylmuramoyl-tripeptide--D-alanyl-D-alanine ligase [Rhodoluna sp.]|nr:UDP-N-acetylmuramoyl-tripeptide--D-alanyl-D-alanine ligase [Rhodoluna sp.]
MIRLGLHDIAEAVGGRLIGRELLVTGSVETDSRLVSAGSLFVCKPGEVTDGHNFAEAAIEAGAVALIVERELDVDAPQILVGDAVLALGRLAADVLRRVRAVSDLKVIGITGSNGKTSTKNMLREILQQFGETIAPIESYNNEVGAPISILKINEKTKYLVVELGAGGVGSIEYLAKIAKPDIGVLLKVGLAHAGEFGGIETTLKIKSELVRELGPAATLVYNSDDALVASTTELTTAHLMPFGTGEDASLRIDDPTLSLKGTSAEIVYPDGTVAKLNLHILGEHQLMNAAAALSVADVLGLDRTASVAALEKMKLAERWRMELSERADGVFVINDAYNASPDSMKAALQTLAQIGRQGHRTIAVLGEMAELGEFSAVEHDTMGRLAVRLNIDQVVVVGSGAKLIHMGASQEGSWDGESKYFDSIAEALEAVRGMLEPGDVVLVKSSKSANLRHLGDDLMEVSI